MYWQFRKNNDFVYALLYMIEREKMHVLLKCCRWDREKIINKYLIKNEKIICEEYGADNNDRDCVVAY